MPRTISRKRKRESRAQQPPNPVKVKIRARKKARKAAEPVKMIVTIIPTLQF
jgi:hypothetical protein